MIYAVKAGSYYHGGNVAEVIPSWGTHPIYVARRKSAKKFWTRSSARKLIEASHRAHSGNFSVEPIWRWVIRYRRGEVV